MSLMETRPSAEELAWRQRMAEEYDVCPDCLGSGVDTDYDGSFTGTVGTVIPCPCTGECP